MQILAIVFSLLHTTTSHCNYMEKGKSGLFYPGLVLGGGDFGSHFPDSFPLFLPLHFKQTFSNKASLLLIPI